MNAERSDFDRTLRSWFADGPTVMSDRVVDGIADRIARQPQRRSWRLRGRSRMNSSAKLVAAVAAVVVVGFVGWQLLPGSAGTGGQPTHSPSPTQLATPTAPSGSPIAVECEDAIPGCAGPLAEGAHATVHFAVPFSFATPADWVNQIDTSTLFALTPASQPSDLILVWTNVVPAESTAGCALQAKPGAGTTAADWMTYIGGHPGLDATNARTVSLGGVTARAIDVRSFGGWASPCIADRKDFNVPMLKTTDGAPGDGYGVRVGAEARFYVADVGSETVVITVYSYSGVDDGLATAAAQAEPVVLSFDFGAR